MPLVTVTIQADPNTSTDKCIDVLFVGSRCEPPPRWRGIEQLGQHYCSIQVFQRLDTYAVTEFNPVIRRNIGEGMVGF